MPVPRMRGGSHEKWSVDSLISDRTIEPSAQSKETCALEKKRSVRTLYFCPIVKKFQQSNLIPFSLKSVCSSIFKYNLITEDTLVEGSLNTLKATDTFISHNPLIVCVKFPRGTPLQFCLQFIKTISGVPGWAIRKQLWLKPLLQLKPLLS